MNTNNTRESLLNAFGENLKMFESMGEEFRDQAKILFQSQLNKMDLVTREEFDATLQSLARATARIEALEKKLGE